MGLIVSLSLKLTFRLLQMLALNHNTEWDLEKIVSGKEV